MARKKTTDNSAAFGILALILKCHGDLGLFLHHTYPMRPLPNSTLTPQFIHYLLLPSCFRSAVTGYTNGSTVNMLPADGLKRPRLVLPPAEFIGRFTEFVTPLIDKAEANYEESRSLTVTRDALLPKLLSGEIKVAQPKKVASC
jgi:type I restriction enzyme, S subunit